MLAATYEKAATTWAGGHGHRPGIEEGRVRRIKSTNHGRAAEGKEAAMVWASNTRERW